MSRTDEQTIECNGIEVVYSEQTNGAGLETRFDFVNSIRKLFPEKKFEHCYEWCSGPGFFGFSLLGAGLCQSLFLADFFEPALVQARKTVNANNLLKKVKIVQSNNWQNISKTEKFDLIVGNPPHFCLQNYYNEIWTYDKRIYIDENWQTHKEFFAGVKEHLAEDGEIVLMECAWGSGVNTFKSMVEDAGLTIANHFLGDFKHDQIGFPIYYLNIKHK